MTAETGHCASSKKLPTNVRPIFLAPTSAVEVNLLSVPIAVLNPRATKLSKKITYEWRTENEVAIYAMNRPDDVPFPQTQHSEIFYVMLAMFSQKISDDGLLYFRLSDVAKNAGYHGDGGSIFTTIKESIWRYSKCQIEFHRGWAKKGKMPENWDGPLIVVNNVFDTKEFNSRKIRKNPRRNESANEWHYVQFHPKVVESVKEKFIRVFLTEVLQSDLSDATKSVYRYFFRFSDKSIVFRDYDILMQAFPWNSGKKRFIGWIESHLLILKERKIIEFFQIQEQGVAVKCNPISKIKLSSAIEIKPIAKQKTNSKSSESDEELLKQIPDLKKQGILTDKTIESLAIILNRSGPAQAAKNLRNYLQAYAP
jgi:hypothetical protein